jgi:NADH:ubiquinone oxidoreductase subunit 6 (subunit J)
MSLETFLFWAIASLTGLCAIAVVVTQNIVRSAMWLLFALAGTAGIFFLLGADFVGATQLLVYVGGTLVLVVFGVMLTAQGPFITMKTGAAEWAIASFVGSLLLAVLTFSILNANQFHFAALDPQRTDDPVSAHQQRMSRAEGSMSSMALGESLLGIEGATPPARLSGARFAGAAPIRTPMAYLLPFEIVSVHLLIVLIGAAYLARAKRRRGGAS